MVVVAGVEGFQKGIQDCSKLISLGGKMFAEFHRGRQQEIHRATNSSLLNTSLTSHSKIQKG